MSVKYHLSNLKVKHHQFTSGELRFFLIFKNNGTNRFIEETKLFTELTITISDERQTKDGYL